MPVPSRTDLDCVVLGGGGHAAVVIDALKSSGAKDRLVVLDPDESKWGMKILDVLVLGDDRMLPELIAMGVSRFIVGLGGTGDNHPRRKLFLKASDLGLAPRTVVHRSAVCSAWVELGAGSVLMPGAVVNAHASLGVNVIVNSGAIVEHDCLVRDHAHIATGASLAASVSVGECAHVGAGAVVRQGVRIGENALIGAGAVVVRDVPAGVTVVGVPAGPLSGRNSSSAHSSGEIP